MKQLFSKWKDKGFWQSGTTDVLSFIIMGPCLIILFAVLVNFTSLGSFDEQLQYTAYVACRAAAVSEDYDTASGNASAVASANMASYGKFTDSDVTVKLTICDKTGTKKSSKNEKNWNKGNYVLCDVKVDYKSVASVMGTDTKSCSIVMAIEHDQETERT